MNPKYLIIACCFSLASCQEGKQDFSSTRNINEPTIYTQPKEENTISGRYVDSTNEIEILQTEINKVNVKLTISNQYCAMPPYDGELTLVTLDTYEGTVGYDLGAYGKDSYHLKLTFKDSLVEVKSDDSWEKWELGAVCWVEGKYLKTN